jgi:hypothetical protein
MSYTKRWFGRVAYWQHNYREDKVACLYWFIVDILFILIGLRKKEWLKTATIKIYYNERKSLCTKYK